MESIAPDPRESRTRMRLLVFAFLAGLSITIVEFAAVRLFAPFFGQSPLVWANVIGVVLLALAIGYAAGGRLAERGRGMADLRRIAILGAGSIGLSPFVGPRCARLLLPEGFSAGPDLTAAALASFTATVVVFTLPLACLGALSPLILRAMSGSGPVGRYAGLAMATSTLGAVAGGYATTLVLIPTFGTRTTLLLCAALLPIATLLVASPRPALLATSLVLLACTLAPELALPSKGGGLPSDRVLAEREGPSQTVRVLERDEFPPWRDGESFVTRVLALDEGDAEYHSIRIEGRVDTLGRYYDLFPLLPELLERPRERVDVLVLGFAAGTTYHVLSSVLRDRLHLTGVEIDPEVLRVAHEFFDIPRDDPRLTLWCGDARVYLRGLDDSKRFDIVIVDCYAQQQYVPFHVATIEFFQLVRRHLADDGVLAANLDSRSAGATLPAAIARTVEAAGFGSVLLLPLPAFPSEILIARESPAKPWLPRAIPGPPFAEVAHAAWQKRRAVRASLETIVLCDDKAPIERIIDRTLRRGEAKP